LCFRGKELPRAEEITRLRDAADGLARSHGLEISTLQLRREPIGMVLRVIIDKPDPGRWKTPDESVGITDCQRVSQDPEPPLLDVKTSSGRTISGKPTRWKFRRRGWIGRCGTRRTTGGSRDGSRRS